MAKKEIHTSDELFRAVVGLESVIECRENKDVRQINNGNNDIRNQLFGVG